MYEDKEQYKELIDELVRKQTKKKSKIGYFLKGLLIVFGVLILLSGLFILSLYLLAV